MAKKSIFSGRKGRSTKFRESDLYKKIYGKTHEERVAEYKEWKQKESLKGFNLSDATKGKEAHQRIDFLMKQLSDEDVEDFRDLYDEDDPDDFFELGQRVISGEDVKALKKEVEDNDKLPLSPTGG